MFAALSDADRIIAEPGARFLDDAGLDAQIEDLADLRNALPVHDVEFDLLERRRDLVLDDFHAGRVADDLVAILDLAGSADVGISEERLVGQRGVSPVRLRRSP